MRALIIGCGNPDRGDDAAGILVARRLRAKGVEALEQTGDGADLMEAWSGHDRVVIVDAVVTGRSAGTITAWDGKSAPVIGDRHRGSTHGFGVAEAVRLARALDRLPQTLTIYGIEGRQFGLSRAPSPEVVAAAERLARHIADEAEAGVSPAP